MHPRNLHKDGYSMAALCQAYAPLRKHLVNAKSGKSSIDFSNPDAVLALNTALLMHYYGVVNWCIPIGYLCPPVPGRADYIHGLADLISKHYGSEYFTSKRITGLDIGTGASAIYPIIGSQAYDWYFVATDIDPVSVKSATNIVSENNNLKPYVTVRKQPNKQQFFGNVVSADEQFTFSMCNPPFHKSEQQATAGSNRKKQGLARSKASKAVPTQPLNFAGTANELWCEGGELGFIQGMISESTRFKDQIDWFTCLVSKSVHLKAIETSVNYYGASQFQKVNMDQGNKQSRFVAWTYQ